MAGGRSSSVPRIYATSITTPGFRWLHEEGWDDGQRVDFAALRLAPPAALYAPPPLVRRAKHPTPQVIGRWLLTPPVALSRERAGEQRDSEARSLSLAAAEAQLQTTQFNSLTLYYSAPRGAWQSWAEAAAKPALTLYISALILLTQADRIRLIPLDPTAAAPGGLGFGGEEQTLWAPLNGLAVLAHGRDHQRLKALDLNPAEWWQLPFAAADRSTLSYLEKRLAGLNKSAGLAASARSHRRVWSLFGRRRS